MPLFSPEVLDIVEDNFDSRTYRRGLAYAFENRVKLLKSTWPAVARVRGTQTYVVTVHYNEIESYLWSDCSCPVRSDCKHAAATAFLVLELEREDSAEHQESIRAQAVGTWLTRIGRDSLEAKSDTKSTKSTRCVAYLLSGELSDSRLCLASTPRLKRGGLGKSSTIRYNSYDIRDLPTWLSQEERRLCILCRAQGESSYFNDGIKMDEFAGGLIEELAETGMLFWMDVKSLPLRWAPPRRESLSWHPHPDDPEQYQLKINGDVSVISTQEILYVDTITGTIGLLSFDVESSLIKKLLEGPPVPAVMLPTAKASVHSLLRLAEVAGEPATGRNADQEAEPQESEPQESEPQESEPWVPVMQPALYVSLDSGGLNIEAIALYGENRYEMSVWGDLGPSRDTESSNGPTPVRDMIAEGRCEERWTELVAATDIRKQYYDEKMRQAAIDRVLKQLAREIMPTLMTEGWHCEFDDAVPARLPVIDAEFVEDLEPVSEGHDWFSLGLGVNIDGKMVPLLPILLQALRNGKIDLSSKQFSSEENQGVHLELEDGTLVYVPGARLQRWLRPLIELNLRGLDKKDKLVVPGLTAADLSGDLPETYLDSSALQGVRKRLAALVDLQPVSPHKSFSGELRDYQCQGLAWLRFLHADGYGGLLADDMGLGKTVQILAFLEGLRVGRKLKRTAPALIVAPRSVVGNWQLEAKRFTPKLKTLIHLGINRASDSKSLFVAPVIITSYQTLLRDIGLFTEQPWTTVVFDEAQAIKNPATKLRRAVARLKAVSRFCVTGTPIENHLGELWSQMDLAMPGILGNRSTFSVVFRKPIEKQGDSRALELMRQRIRPFMLRRTKGDVDIDLPDKTEIIERVPLETAQRDLYESLRLILDKKVRKALKDRGVSGSSLIILDALTRLRQCCCDARLVKTPEAKKVKHSAKLERLMSMLEELTDAGRFALVFSQFTSMLSIIEDRCKEAGIGYVKLTGQTVKREKVIAEFQSGQVPVFLISLKAGGVGLNLTQADTVIHYDPWWNPAAENQATDRAHRIGQTKNVMVYKLIAQATLEEQILVMQAQKQKLTDAALKEGGLTHFGADDLRALFQSL